MAIRKKSPALLKKSPARKKNKTSKKTPIGKKISPKTKNQAKVKTRKIIAKKSDKSAVRTKPKLLKARKANQKKSPSVPKKQLNPNLVQTIESYGAYVVAKHGFVKLGPYLHIDRFVDFKHLHEIPYIERGSEKLTLILFAKDANERSFSFAARPIQTTIDIQEITPDIKPLADPDRYEVTLNTPLSDGHMLHIQSGHFYDGRLSVIMLGNTQAELEKYFSDKSLDGAIYVRAYLEDALQAFPENVKLQKLMAHWEKAAANEKDNNDYKYVNDKWRDYENQNSLSMKIRYLYELIGEVNAYLRDHADGAHVAEANKRKAYAEKKLPEYEKMA